MENPRRQFKLSSDDEAKYLDGLGLDWETIIVGDQRQQWVIIHDWKTPIGYNYEAVRLALLIPASYPDVEINMFYVSPALERSDKRAINRLTDFKLGDETWQQWSRHRTPSNPWRPGEDDLVSHLALVAECLERGVS